MKIGIDLGDTITSKLDAGRVIFPNAFEVIKRLVDAKHEVYIVSKVNPEQKIRSLKWLEEVRFFELTGVPKDNLYYCETWSEKAPICKNLGIEVHIDDRPQVMACFPEGINKILFKPDANSVLKFFNFLKNSFVANDWLEVEAELLSLDKSKKSL